MNRTERLDDDLRAAGIDPAAVEQERMKSRESQLERVVLEYLRGDERGKRAFGEAARRVREGR
jgi:hypothetical protein